MLEKVYVAPLDGVAESGVNPDAQRVYIKWNNNGSTEYFEFNHIALQNNLAKANIKNEIPDYGFPIDLDKINVLKDVIPGVADGPFIILDLTTTTDFDTLKVESTGVVILKNDLTNSIENENKYELDLSEYGYNATSFEEPPNFNNEPSSIQLKKLRIKQEYNDQEWEIPPNFFGKIIKLDYLFSLSSEKITSILKVEQFTDGIYFGVYGLTNENQNGINFYNDVSSEYSINNALSKKIKEIGGSIAMISGGAVVGKSIVSSMRPLKKDSNNLLAGLASMGIGVKMLASLAEMKLQPDKIQNLDSDLNFKFLNSDKLRFVLIEKTYFGDALKIKQIQEQLEGNVINKYFNTLFPYERYYYNYVSTNSVFSNLKIKDRKGNIVPVSANIKQLISESLENGIHFFHYRDPNTFKGINNFSFENTELSQLSNIENKNEKSK